jgi:hypothetical protein
VNFWVVADVPFDVNDDGMPGRHRAAKPRLLCEKGTTNLYAALNVVSGAMLVGWLVW